MLIFSFSKYFTEMEISETDIFEYLQQQWAEEIWSSDVQFSDK